MARKPEEEYEDEEEEYEDDGLSPILRKKLERLYKEYDRIQDQMDKEDPSTPRYSALARSLEELTRSIENLESAGTEQTTRHESRNRMDDAKEERKFRIAQLVGTITGSFVSPILVETIRQRANSKNVERVTQYEDDGHIVNSKAIKFVK